MLGSVLANGSLRALEETVQFAQARHNVLAGNIANFNVPGYKVRDLSTETFQLRLKQALEAREKPAAERSPGMPPGQADAELRKVHDSLEGILYHDGTNVSMEQQVTEINKNLALHNMAVSLLTSQYRLLQTAISERV